MKELKEYFDALLHGDSFLEVMMERRKETVKLAAIAVVVLMVVLLYLHQDSAELAIEETGPAGAGQSQALDASPDAAEGSDAEREDAGALMGQEEAGMPADTDGIVYVDIGGAVKQPMLAELPSGSRVEDAIRAAGGLKKDADLSEVNRAQVLTDGEKIYIPSEGEETAAAGQGTAAAGNMEAPAPDGISGGRININTADVVLLQQLTGVGPVTAQKIVDYRESNGGFRAIEDLKNVSGIGEKTFEKMKDQVTV